MNKTRTLKIAAWCLAAIACCLFVAGCAKVPSTVQGSIATASAALKVTVKEAAVKEVPPWKVPADETAEQKLTRVEKQVVLLVETMAQASKNLDAAVAYFRADRNTDPETVEGGDTE